MIKNYIKMNLRNILTHKGYSFINILGLAIGMACCILILLFIQDELSYDTYHENADQIYRLVIEAEIGGSLDNFAVAPFAAPPTFNDELPEVISFTRLFNLNGQITIDDRQFEEERIFFADTTFFEIFSHTFLRGDPETILDEPGAVVITEETAQRLFGNENPIGKTIQHNQIGELHIEGIVENVPENSHFHFNYIISMATIEGARRAFLNQWLSINGWGYLLLEKGTDPRVVEEKFVDIVENHTGQTARQYGISFVFFLQKLTDIHLRSHLQAEVEENNNIVYVYTFAAVAIFILIIACINFMNLSTARSASRAKEVGLRKVMGAAKKNLVYRFLSESLFLSVLALVIAIGIVWLTLPAFNNFADKQMTIMDLGNGAILSGILGLIVFTGILAGSYPAFILSAFQPISVLRGDLSSGSKRSSFRKVMVVSQFSISIVLIVCTFIVVNQVDYMKNKDLGFDKEQIVVVTMQTSAPQERFQTIREELLQHTDIFSASFSTGVPGRGGELRLFVPEGNDSTETHAMRLYRTDFDFVSTYGMEISQGRDFSFDLRTDSTQAFLINQTAANKLGWPDEAVGKDFEFVQVREGKIVGVVEDFHFASLTEEISPIVFMVAAQPGFLLSLKINPNNVDETIAFIEEKWGEFEPDRPLDYYFLDDDFSSRYNAEEKVSDIVGVFAILGIFVAALGLFGLVSFMAEQRTKELGIRKAMGASVSNLFVMVSREFAVLVVVSNVIAWPVAYYIMQYYWLQDFPYRISPAMMTFLLAGVLSLIVALLTTSFQSLKAARANPVDSLRYE